MLNINVIFNFFYNKEKKIKIFFTYNKYYIFELINNMSNEITNLVFISYYIFISVLIK